VPPPPTPRCRRHPWRPVDSALQTPVIVTASQAAGLGQSDIYDRRLIQLIPHDSHVGVASFSQPRTSTELANKAFSVAGPSAWNSLPSRIRSIDSKHSFCKQLKTYLLSYSIPILTSLITVFTYWLIVYVCVISVFNFLFLIFVFTILAQIVRRHWAPAEWRHRKSICYDYEFIIMIWRM